MQFCLRQIHISFFCTQDMEVTNKTSVLVDAKNEYTHQLVEVVCVPILAVFDRMYRAAASQKTPLRTFQRMLQEIPDWNNHAIRDHTDTISRRCPWFSELLTAVFVSHVKVLTSVRLSGSKPNIKVKVPSNESFVHLLMVEMAREFYTNPYMFKEGGKDAKMAVLNAAVEKSVRKMLPVRDILRAYLGGTVDDDRNYNDVSSESEEPEPDLDAHTLPPLSPAAPMPAEPLEKTVHIVSGEPKVEAEDNQTLFSDAESE
jgi:hypothetical protein